MRNNTLLGVGIGLVAVALVGATAQTAVSDPGPGSGWWNYMGSPGHMTGWSQGTDSVGIRPAIEGAAESTVVADDFGFNPETVTIEIGDPVNLTVVNRGVVPHDFVVPGLDLRIPVSAGEQATVGLVPASAGSFQILCSYPGHAQQGMVGTLIVTGPA